MSSTANSAARAVRPAAEAGQKWLPVIDPEACTGCNACIEACPPGCLDLTDRLAVLVTASTCESDEHCVEACKDEAIRMEWVDTRERDSLGRWR